MVSLGVNKEIYIVQNSEKTDWLQFQSQSLIAPSHPHVTTLEVSCGNHRQPIHTESWTLNLV